MNKNIIILLAIAVLGLVALFTLWPNQTCEAANGSCSTPSAVESKTEKIKAKLEANTALLIDVREPSEFAAGRAVDAVNIPLGQIENGQFKEADKAKELFIYCRSGRRAEMAKTVLEKQGYTNIKNLGGLSDWQSMGGGVVR